MVSTTNGDPSRFTASFPPTFPEYLPASWRKLKLVAAELPSRYEASVIDSLTGDILFRVERVSLNAAKFAAVEFAIAHSKGPGSNLTPEAVTHRLPWCRD